MPRKSVKTEVVSGRKPKVFWTPGELRKIHTGIVELVAKEGAHAYHDNFSLMVAGMNKLEPARRRNLSYSRASFYLAKLNDLFGPFTMPNEATPTPVIVQPIGEEGKADLEMTSDELEKFGWYLKAGTTIKVV